jgi:hypothetical protein
MLPLRQVAAETELEFLYDTVRAAKGKCVGRDAVWQLAPVFASIRYSSDSTARLRSFAEAIQISLPRLANHGQNRARKAFVRGADTITKPSYVARLDRGDVWGLSESQRSVLIENFVREPLTGGLVFSVFHPRDLLDRKRPGYIPCLVSGSLLVHKKSLQLNAFFRSQSIIEFGVHDLLFLRDLQADFLRSAASYEDEHFPSRMRRIYRKLTPGRINLHFGRIVIPSRLARNRSGHLHRSDTVDVWMSQLVEQIDLTAS